MRCNSCGADNPQDAKFCALCGKTIVAYTGQGTAPQQATQQPSIWFQNYYRIRKKVLAITNQYWIENAQGNVLGYTKQKMFRLKEDIRVFSDESMSQELFKIMQRQILDIWGTFAVIDSSTNVCVGMIKRSISSALLEDEYYILDQNGQQIGRVIERTGRGLARKYVPLGGLIPQQVKVEFYGQQVAAG